MYEFFGTKRQNNRAKQRKRKLNKNEYSHFAYEWEKKVDRVLLFFAVFLLLCSFKRNGQNKRAKKYIIFISETFKSAPRVWVYCCTWPLCLSHEFSTLEQHWEREREISMCWIWSRGERCRRLPTKLCRSVSTRWDALTFHRTTRPGIFEWLHSFTDSEDCSSEINICEWIFLTATAHIFQIHTFIRRFTHCFISLSHSLLPPSFFPRYFVEFQYSPTLQSKYFLPYYHIVWVTFSLNGINLNATVAWASVCNAQYVYCISQQTDGRPDERKRYHSYHGCHIIFVFDCCHVSHLLFHCLAVASRSGTFNVLFLLQNLYI